MFILHIVPLGLLAWDYNEDTLTDQVKPFRNYGAKNP